MGKAIAGGKYNMPDGSVVDANGRVLKASSAAPDQGGEKTLDDHTANELKALAAERGIDLGDATKKAEIVTLIEAAGEQGGQGGE